MTFPVMTHTNSIERLTQNPRLMAPKTRANRRALILRVAGLIAL